MFHDAIDFFSLLVGILGIIALWIEPKQPWDRHRFIKFSFSAFIVIFVIYLLVNHYRERQKEQSQQAELENKENQTLELLCQKDMNYEEIYNTINLGWSDEVLNAALDDLLQKRQVITVTILYLPSPILPNKQTPVGFYHRRDRSACSSASK